VTHTHLRVYPRVSPRIEHKVSSDVPIIDVAQTTLGVPSFLESAEQVHQADLPVSTAAR
jgi:hypothetical protein